MSSSTLKNPSEPVPLIVAIYKDGSIGVISQNFDRPDEVVATHILNVWIELPDSVRHEIENLRRAVVDLPPIIEGEWVSAPNEIPG
jgi:hypothetical protein